MGPFRVLFVCTGNICRSPTAERLLAARLSGLLPGAQTAFEIHSAGTLDLAGAGMEPNAANALAALGVAPDGHAARALRAAEVLRADLLLAMTRKHRGEAIQLAPQVSARAFTLFEFARYCANLDPTTLPAGDPPDLPARARAIVRAAAARRGLDRPDHPSDDDLPDPLGAPYEAFVEAAAAIDEALRPFLHLLAPGGTPGGLAGAAEGGVPLRAVGGPATGPGDLSDSTDF